MVVKRLVAMIPFLCTKLNIHRLVRGPKNPSFHFSLAHTTSHSTTRPARSQIPSLEIRRLTLTNFIRFTDLLISRLPYCERTGRMQTNFELYKISNAREKHTFCLSPNLEAILLWKPWFLLVIGWNYELSNFPTVRSISRRSCFFHIYRLE